MHRPLSFRAMLVVLAGALLSGCVARPPEKPIVLRRPHTERRPAASPAAHKPAVAAPSADPTTAPPPDPAPAVPATPAAPAPPLTPEQKKSLFQDFDRYLARPTP